MLFRRKLKMFHLIDRPNEVTAAQIAWVVSQFQKAELSVKRTIFEQLHSHDTNVTRTAAETLYGFIKSASEEDLATFAMDNLGTREVDFLIDLYNPLRKLAEHFFHNLKKVGDEYLIEPYDTLFYKQTRVAYTTKT